MSRQILALAALLSASLSVADAHGLSPILLVDDDNGRKYEKRYKAWCDSAGLRYVQWEIQSMGIPSLEHLVQYPTVLWFTGDYGSLSEEEEVRLKEYLDSSRGTLMLTGDGLANSLRHGFNDHQQFLGWYLNARYIRTEGDPDIGVNSQSDVFRFAYLPAIFHNYTSDGYHFRLWNMADVVKPNDNSYRMSMLPVMNSGETKNALECVALSNRKPHFKTVFITFDLAREDSRHINEPEFIKACVEWLQR